MKGEEVTDQFGTKPIHINGFAPERLHQADGRQLGARHGAEDGRCDSRGARGARASTTPISDGRFRLMNCCRYERTRLFEIFNGHPTVNNFGGGGVPGLEEVWDRMLSSGKLLYGIAVDDAHYFKRPDDRSAPRPGQGWVHVRAPRLESRALLGGARARRLLFLDRRRAAVADRDQHGPDHRGEDRAAEQVPHSIHRQAGQAC